MDDLEGFKLVGNDGLHNMPPSPKCFYQFGQRIVGWSRVAQTVTMELIAPYVENVICGDTDSIKIYIRNDNEAHLERALSRHAKALDKAKKSVCARVRRCYPAMYDELDGIGHYVLDGSYEGFYAAWNKAYIGLSGGKCKATIAGIPTNRRHDGNNSYNDLCDWLTGQVGFERACSIALGYNVSLDHSLTKLNARIHPQWCDYIEKDIEDYLGNVSHVKAPSVMALHPMVKVLGDTTNPENARNSQIAKVNNPAVNLRPIWLKYRCGKFEIEGDI